MQNPTAAPTPSLAAVPKAVWAVLGGLALATAGLTGAFIARETAPAAPAAAVAGPAAPLASLAPTGVATPAAVPTVQPEAPAARVAEPAPARPHVAPKAQPVARAPSPQHAPAAPVVQPAPQPLPAPVAQAPMAQPVWAPQPEPVRAVCATCGTVEAVRVVQEQGAGTGIGAVGGAVAGGLLGHQVGGGNGKKALTVLGAVGGALAGHEIEKRARASTSYDVVVRLEDGSTRTVRQAEPPAVGTRVQLEGGTLRQSSGGGMAAPASQGVPVLRTAG